MYLHTFEVVTDGDRTAFTFTSPHHTVRVRHRLVELEPPTATDDHHELAVDDWEWDDFALDEA